MSQRESTPMIDPRAGARLRLVPRARVLPAPSEGPGGPSLWLVSGQRVPINETAAQLLARCDGSRTAQQLAQACPDRDAALEFLATATALGWVTALEGESPDPECGPARR